eukprot:gene4456-6302_t
MSSFNQITVGYWGIRGLASALRMMVMYKGYPLNAVCYDVKYDSATGQFDRTCWMGGEDSAKNELIKLNPLMNLPYVIDGDMVVTQSNACMSYLGRKFGMLGKNEVEVTECEMLLCECMDLRNNVVRFCYGGKDENDARSLISSVATGTLPKLEAWLALKQISSPVFFVGDGATAPDFHIWEMLDQLHAVGTHFGCLDEIAQFSLLSAFYSNFAKLAENQKYFNSRLFKLPFNNKTAFFGSSTSGDLHYTAGQDTPWHETTGLY